MPHEIFVYRRVGDIEFKLDGTETLEAFLAKFLLLGFEHAGVPKQLEKFRAGDTTLIATEKLQASAKPTKVEENQVKLAGRHFFTALRNTAQALQSASQHALQILKPEITKIQDAASEFSGK